jgi:HSP20 family protein
MALTTLTRPEQKLQPYRDPINRIFDRDLRLMRQMTRDFDRLFGGFGVPLPVFDRPAVDPGWIPDLEVFQKDNRLIVRADLPGMKKEDVKVNIQDNMLILEGERKVEEDVKKDGFHRTERTYGSFFRTLPLPEGAKFDKVNATFKDGVLEIGMPMEPATKPITRVEVKIA